MAGNFAPDPYLCPRSPSVIRFRYTSLLYASPDSDILTFGSRGLSLQQNRGYVKNQATPSDLPFYNFFVPSKFLFQNFLMTSLHVICVLTPQSKIFATPIVMAMVLITTTFGLAATDISLFRILMMLFPEFCFEN